ncbi:MAG: arsenic resistance N-acetyltransferase ArsN2 [Acidobacteriota bacterium]|nr:arsenic resistance N-acetyltransferase ArsN2 [Acidobacteriota bacterium]MDH3784180.1 arsenic resistance N-acetyltransferase ArsN2 [Acidobacteriota bacterium]
MTAIRPALAGDLPAIHELLQEASLTTVGVERHLPSFLVAEADQRLLAVAGLEIHGSVALIRSIAVREELRRTGLGRRLFTALVAHARARDVQTCYLLTETAPGFFKKLGFDVITRDDAPDEIRRTDEFSSLCSPSAILLKLSIGDNEIE